MRLEAAPGIRPDGAFPVWRDAGGDTDSPDVLPLLQPPFSSREGGFRSSDPEQLAETCLWPEINKCFHCHFEAIWCAFLSQYSLNPDHFFFLLKPRNPMFPGRFQLKHGRGILGWVCLGCEARFCLCLGEIGDVPIRP